MPIRWTNQQTWDFQEEILPAKTERKFIKECLVGQSASGFISQAKQAGNEAAELAIVSAIANAQTQLKLGSNIYSSVVGLI